MAETIVIDDDDEADEDIGVPLERNPPSSPDPIAMDPLSRTNRPQKLMVERPDVHPFSDDVERVDGPSTEAYRKSYSLTVEERKKRKGKEPEQSDSEVIPDSDPISQFHSDSPTSPTHLDHEPTRMPTPSRTLMPSVSATRATFEQPPHLDLRKNVKSHMKPRKKVFFFDLGHI